MLNMVDSLTDEDSTNLTLVTVAELCVSRTETYTAGWLGKYTLLFFRTIGFGVWAFSLRGSAPQYRIPISATQPLSERIRINLDIKGLLYLLSRPVTMEISPVMSGGFQAASTI